MDERIERGTTAMLELRRSTLADGARPVGWKLGFGTPAAFEQLGTDRPLVGFLTDRTGLPDAATVAIGDWTKPTLEPEIAVHLARDVGGGASDEEVQEAIGGLSAAIELVDIHPPPSEPESILAGNIFHRHFVLGPVDHERTTAEGVTGRLVRDGEETARTDDPQAMTGKLAAVVRMAADDLGAAGETLRAGDVIITGSVVPALAVEPGQHVTADLGPLGSVSVTLSA
ncbi:MAG TPA: fumarylacetoacetate hydrolase family protein [Solirubrobacteraceae bacterium]|nr:fumarylacetoacetate hydrolase family protein [Solirubrobacteraceae bacterium]